MPDLTIVGEEPRFDREPRLKLRVTPRAIKAVSPILAPVLDFCRGLSDDLSDPEIAMQIENHFGDRLLAEVCIPNGMTMGACLVVLLALLKNGTLA